MTTTLKFNRKVYVIPEEKYNAMVRDRELRDGGETERGSAQSRRPPAQASTAKDGPLRTLSASADALSGGPETHSSESGRGSETKVKEGEGEAEKAEKVETEKEGVKKTPTGSTGSTGPTPSNSSSDRRGRGRGRRRRGSQSQSLSGGTDPSSRTVQENAIRRTLFVLLNPKKRRDLMKVYSALFDGGKDEDRSEKKQRNNSGGEGLTIPGLPNRDLFLALLHTQCERADRPDNYKALYSRLLRNKVPLTRIGNKRLRRVLHYLKNKRSHSRSTNNAGSGNSDRVTGKHHSRGRRSNGGITGRINTQPLKEGLKKTIAGSKSRNARKPKSSWVRI